MGQLCCRRSHLAVFAGRRGHFEGQQRCEDLHGAGRHLQRQELKLWKRSPAAQHSTERGTAAAANERESTCSIERPTQYSVNRISSSTRSHSTSMMAMITAHSKPQIRKAWSSIPFTFCRGQRHDIHHRPQKMSQG